VAEAYRLSEGEGCCAAAAWRALEGTTRTGGTSFEVGGLTGGVDYGVAVGLAHLAEHLTLAAGEGSGGALGRLIDDLEGDLNAFTAEEATTFCCSWTADADGELAEAEAATEEARALREVGRRFATMFEPPPAGALEAVAAQELGRVDEEMAAATDLPGRSLLEIVQLKARSRPDAAWARLARGDARTLPPARATELVAAVRELRRRRYGARAATLAIVTPLPLAAAAAILGGAFGSMPSGPVDVPAAGAAAAEAALPFGAAGVPPAALISPSRKRAALAVTWCVPVPAGERAAAAAAQAARPARPRAECAPRGGAGGGVARTGPGTACGRARAVREHAHCRLHVAMGHVAARGGAAARGAAAVGRGPGLGRARSRGAGP